MTDKKSPQTPATPDDSDVDPSQLDAHGHDPTAYDWVPVLRKPRKDGWTPERQRAFIGALADSGVVIDAARSVGMSDTAAYTLRRAPGAEGFAAAWEAALQRPPGGWSILPLTVRSTGSTMWCSIRKGSMSTPSANIMTGC